jgi:hypothetical protein
MSELNRLPLALLVLLAGCASHGGAAEEKAMDDPPEASPSDDLDARLEARRRLGRIPGEAVPAESEPAPTGEVPAAVMTELVADASVRSRVPAAEVEVRRAESLIFPDGSLGCAKPDVAYTPAPVPGYRVVLEAGGKEYDYRVPEGGRFVLCEGSGPLGGPMAPIR